MMAVQRSHLALGALLLGSLAMATVLGEAGLSVYVLLLLSAGCALWCARPSRW